LLVDDASCLRRPVEKYVPEFKDLWVIAEQSPERRVLVKAARSITLRDLLSTPVARRIPAYGHTGVWRR